MGIVDLKNKNDFFIVCILGSNLIHERMLLIYGMRTGYNNK